MQVIVVIIGHCCCLQVQMLEKHLKGGFQQRRNQQAMKYAEEIASMELFLLCDYSNCLVAACTKRN